MQNKIVLFSVCILVSFAFVPIGIPVRNIDPPEANTVGTMLKKTPSVSSVEEKIDKLYHVFSLKNTDMPSHVSFQNGMLGYYKLVEKGKIKNKVLTIVDFSLPSAKKRMWVLDMTSNQVLFHTYVAHGQGTGLDMATKFSNTPSSHQSSLGFYLTAETYYGKHGLSMRLDGLEKGFNSNARERYIVVHGAKYATSAFVKRVGRLGRSWGCPAVPKKLSEEIIAAIKGKSCFFIYYPSEKYLQKSRFLDLE